MAKSGRGEEWKNLGDVNGTLVEAHGECRAKQDGARRATKERRKGTRNDGSFMALLSNGVATCGNPARTILSRVKSQGMKL